MNLIEWILENKETILLLITNIATVVAIAVPKLVGDSKTRGLLKTINNVHDQTKSAEKELTKKLEAVNVIAENIHKLEVNNEIINSQLDRISELSTTINELKTQMTLLKDDLRNIKNNHMGD